MQVALVLMDAENYSQYPVNQFEEDNVLRELNKCLIGFRQNTPFNVTLDSNGNSKTPPINSTPERRPTTKSNSIQRRYIKLVNQSRLRTIKFINLIFL